MTSSEFVVKICTTVWVALLMTLPLFAQQIGNFAGRTVFATDDVVAIDENDIERQLRRRSEIFAGDTLVTNSEARAQFRMTDSAILSLDCSTKMKVEDYWFEGKLSDTVTLRLLEGRLRTITGAVGQQGESYGLFVNDSVLTIIGTDFEVYLADNGTAYFAVYDGSILVSNQFGSLQLGIGAAADFALVEPGLPPSALMTQPRQLGFSTALLSTETPQSVTSSSCMQA